MIACTDPPEGAEPVPAITIEGALVYPAPDIETSELNNLPLDNHNVPVAVVPPGN